MWSVTSAFDGGNIEFVDQTNDVVALRIQPDIFTELEKKEHFQWFYFRAQASPGTCATFRIVNAGQASYPKDWYGITISCSTDRRNWWRAPATFTRDAGTLEWRVELEKSQSQIFCAFFEPYPLDRHLDVVAACASRCTVRTLALSPGKRSVDCVEVGTGPLHAWVTCRVHPGEPQGAWFGEGLLGRLLGGQLYPDARTGDPDGLVRRALAAYTWHVVPCVCPDGVALGHLRTNSLGANLNREWGSTGEYTAPTAERSPEIFGVLQAMDKTGVDLMIDAHGDEGIPYVFLAGSEGVPGWCPRWEQLHGAFTAAYVRANPDIQASYSYDPDPLGKANLACGSNQVAHRYKCFAATLEMPYKDNLANPDSSLGFSGKRCMDVGASLVDAAVYVAPFLRTEGELSVGPADAYVRPMDCGPLGDPTKNPNAA